MKIVKIILSFIVAFNMSIMFSYASEEKIENIGDSPKALCNKFKYLYEQAQEYFKKCPIKDEFETKQEFEKRLAVWKKSIKHFTSAKFKVTNLYPVVFGKYNAESMLFTKVYLNVFLDLFESDTIGNHLNIPVGFYKYPYGPKPYSGKITNVLPSIDGEIHIRAFADFFEGLSYLESRSWMDIPSGTDYFIGIILCDLPIFSDTARRIRTNENKVKWEMVFGVDLNTEEFNKFLIKLYSVNCYLPK